MASAPSKLNADDSSLLMVLLDTNPFFWSTSSLAFSQFLSHVLAFLNSILLLNQLNEVVVIATGYSSCGYIYDSSSVTNMSNENGGIPALYSSLLWSLEEFLNKDEQLSKTEPEGKIASSLLSGSLSLALCYVQRLFRSGPLHPQPRILCLQGSPDGPEQYVAIMNAIFSAQRSMVPIDSCCVGSHNSAFLQQASYITGGVYVKPQHSDGLFPYLSPALILSFFTYETRDGLRQFLLLICIHAAFYNFQDLLELISGPRKLTEPFSCCLRRGCKFLFGCFCHKSTIDMGYICSVCLSIFCKHHKKCSTCGSVFGQAQPDVASASDRKRKNPEA